MVVKDVMYGKTKRKSFARYQEILDMPNLLEVQKNSYQWFLDTGLREVFRDVEAITDYAGNLELSFIDYSMDEKPKYDVEECKARDATYAAPIKVKVRLRNKETEEIKEQEIFMGDFPIMTNSGTFVINGAERVIVSQITRSPGMYFTDTADKADNHTYGTTVIPYRGAWLEYETDLSNVFYVRIDKNRKLPITCLIRAVGPKTDAEIIEMFGEDERILATMEKDPPCWRSTASCAPASPPRWTPPRPCSTPPSTTPAGTTCPPWAAISSTRRWPCGPACPAAPWPCPWPTPAPARSLPRPGRPLPGSAPRSWTTPA